LDRTLRQAQALLQALLDDRDDSSFATSAQCGLVAPRAARGVAAGSALNRRAQAADIPSVWNPFRGCEAHHTHFAVHALIVGHAPAGLFPDEGKTHVDAAKILLVVQIRAVRPLR
jgi:hypothetical protein